MFLSFRRPWARVARPSSSVTQSRRAARLTLESLETRVVPSVTIDSTGLVSVVGTPGNDTFVIQLQKGTPTNIQFSDDGGSTFTTFSLTSANGSNPAVSGVNVQGLTGKDRLVLDASNGLVGAATPLPITFDGGQGFDTLALQGNPPDGSVDLTYTVGTTAFAGKVEATNGTDSSVVTFTHVESVLDTMTAASLTVNADDNPNLILVTGGPTVDGTHTMTVRVFDRLTPAGQGGGGDDGGDNNQGNEGDDRGEGDDRHRVEVRTFAPITFANVAKVTVNGLGGNDLFALAAPNPADGLTSLTLDGGDGTDVAAVLVAPSGVTVTYPNVEKVITDTDDAFIEDAYMEHLGREADDAGLHAWEKVLRNGGRSAVIQGIEDSLEGRDAFVQQLYLHDLGRNAVSGEEMGWVNALLSGASEEQVESGILGSAEFRQLAQSLTTSGSADERFVQALYQVLLNRQAGSGEASGWASVAQSFGDDAVTLAVLHSAEFRTNTVSSDYQSLLKRAPDAPGLSNWVFSGLGLGQVRGAIESSWEFGHGD